MTGKRPQSRWLRKVVSNLAGIECMAAAVVVTVAWNARRPDLAVILGSTVAWLVGFKHRAAEQSAVSQTKHKTEAACQVDSMATLPSSHEQGMTGVDTSRPTTLIYTHRAF